MQKNLNKYARLRKIYSKNYAKRKLILFEQWAHIIDSHDYMAGNLDLMFEALENPDYIVEGWTTELIALKHYDEDTDVLYMSFQKPQHADDSIMEDNIVYHHSGKKIVGITVIGAKKYG